MVKKALIYAEKHACLLNLISPTNTYTRLYTVNQWVR